MQPFLSIVIPCYNSRMYLEKNLTAILQCNIPIEVILADDCSVEDYTDIIQSFSSLLNIVQCKTDYNSGNPSNARELGASKATGVYLTFVDHDDYVIPEGIRRFKHFVEVHNYPEYLVAGIRQVDDDGNVEIEKFDILPFLHAKFFHLDKFYRRCDLHHKKDIKYQEDNYFTALVACNLIKYDIQPIFLDFCTYNWHNNCNSLGNQMLLKKKTDKAINLEMFETNILITTEVMFKYFDEGALPTEVATEWLIREIVSFYFDSQMYFQFYEDYVKLLKPILKGVKSRLNLTNAEIIDCVQMNNGRIFQDEYDNVLQFFPEGVQPTVKLREMLEQLDPDGTTI